MPVVSLNYWAIIVCPIASMVLGMLWYSPILFGKPWSKLMGFSAKSKAEMKTIQKEAGPAYLGSLLGNLVMAYVLAYVVDYAMATTVVGGLIVGFWCWLGFVATTMLTGVLWAAKPYKLYLIDASYQLVTLLVFGAILAAWV